MAVSEQTPYKEYIANGVTTSFPLEFDCDNQDHLIVTVNDVEPENGQWQLINGSVVFPIAPANQALVIIKRNTPLERSTNYQSTNNSFRPQPVNKDFDRIWWKLQELWLQVTLLWAALNSKVATLWAALLKETQDRIKGDLDIRAWVQVLLNNIVDNGLVSAIAVTTVESIADLKYLVPWEGRTVYVKGYYKATNFALAQPYKGGGTRIYVASRGYEDDGFLCINGWVLQEDYPNPFHAGAFGDGVYDDAVPIQKVVNAFNYVNLKNAKWFVTKKINIPSYRMIDLDGSDLIANNGSDPIFNFEEAGDNLYIKHGGGLIRGTADCFLKCTGSTSKPTSVSHYARQIRLDGLYIVSETIDKFLDFQDAVRQVFMNKVHAYTKNGINANGKCVEVKAHGSIIYGSTSDLSTYGLKLRAPEGEYFYSEGFHFTDCTLDAFGKTLDVNDIYVLSVTGGHLGSLGSGNAAYFGQPNSTACRDIKFTGVNIAGSIEFAPVNGLDYQAKLTGCTQEMCNGINIHIKNNAASIDISDHKFHTSTNGIAIVCEDNNASINISNITCDLTYIGGVQIKGPNGANCSIRDISYVGTGDPVYLERPVLLSDIPATSETVLSYLQKFNANSIQNAYAIGANIASVDSWFVKGETGNIVCEIGFSGANATTQRFDVIVPDGMIIPSGSGWSSQFILPNSSAGRLSVRIPYRITKDISSQPLILKNSVGNTITIDYHSSFGVQRNF